LWQKRAKDSPCIPEVDTQLVSETGHDILTITLAETEPVLYRVSRPILLLEGTAVPTVRSRPLVFTGGIGTRTQADLVPGHIPNHSLILFTGLVAGTGPEHLDIAVAGSDPAPLPLAVLEFFLARCVTGHLVLYLQAAACFFSNARCLHLRPGCHNGSRREDKDQHCA